MFTNLKLKNFKAWRDSDEIPLKPVTLLLGSNSTGKSSLIQSLLLLKQTVMSPDRSIHLNLGGDEVNDYFNFGHFNDVLTQGASPRQFEISFEFGPPRLQRRTSEFVRQGKFSATYAMNSSGAAITQECCLEGTNRSYRAVRRDKGAYSIYVGDESQPREKSRTFAPERSIALPSEAIQLLGLDGGFAQDLSLAIRRELENISYLGPLRRKPERDYVWNKSRPGDLGVDGYGSINALFSSSFLKGKDTGEDIIAGVSMYLQRMGVAERLEVRQLGHSTRYEIVVHRDGVEANLRDVGIGISQVLPVLTLAYYAPKGSTILLEEPEIHLHPLAQSVLAELFVEISKERQVQFIVETHSEHLFRRMQTLLAKESLPLKQCAMYFVEREGADAKLRTLEANEFGAINNWPDKFFGDAMGEAREQAKARAERELKKRSH
jgi:predicted ATPase